MQHNASGITRSLRQRNSTILDYYKSGGSEAFAFNQELTSEELLILTEVYRNAAADGVRRLQIIWKHIFGIAGDYI